MIGRYSDPACFIGWECRVVQFDKYVFVFEVLSWCSCWMFRAGVTLGLILYYYTLLLLYTILFSLPLLSFFLFSSSDLSSLLPLSHSLPCSFTIISFHSIRVGTYLRLFIFQQYPIFPITIWPRMFYRSGWLRCVGLISVVFWAAERYRWGFECLCFERLGYWR